MKTNKIFLVIPTIRDLRFLESWKSELSKVTVLVIEDNLNKSINIPFGVGRKVLHYCWSDIKNDFGGDEWIFSRKNSGIRSYGFWKAFQLGADVVVSIDDDCYPTKDHLIQRHVDNLSTRVHSDGWVSTYPGKEWMYTRGFPYEIRESRNVWVSHGLWSGALDLDGQTEVKNGELLNEKACPSIFQVIPRGQYYPMCSMNFAFIRKATPLMFSPMMGQDPDGDMWGYDRFDDIWAGIFSKKVLDYLGYGVVNGSPFVEHRKKSIPKHNMEKEKAGLKINENFWKWVNEVQLTKTTPAECYMELAEKVDFPDSTYFDKLREAMVIWARLFL